jgi:uncharacterized protein
VRSAGEKVGRAIDLDWRMLLTGAEAIDLRKDTDVFARDGDRLLLFSIAQDVKDRSIYDAARYAWRVDLERAKKATLILGCVKGVVEGVFVAGEWLDASPGEATKRNFPGFTYTHKGPRWGFKGREADKASQDHYLGKHVPDNLSVGQNGVRYSYRKVES